MPGNLSVSRFLLIRAAIWLLPALLIGAYCYLVQESTPEPSVYEARALIAGSIYIGIWTFMYAGLILAETIWRTFRRKEKSWLGWVVLSVIIGILFSVSFIIEYL